jgi:hypothetical protein
LGGLYHQHRNHQRCLQKERRRKRRRKRKEHQSLNHPLLQRTTLKRHPNLH